MKLGIRFLTVDAGQMLDAGQEPFPEIRRTVELLKPGEGLEVVAPFLPSPLIEILGSEGFEHEIEHHPDGGWAVRFWRT